VKQEYRMAIVGSRELETRLIPPIALVVNDEPLTLEMSKRALASETEEERWLTGSDQLEAIEYGRDLRPDIIVPDLVIRRDGKGPNMVRGLRATPNSNICRWCSGGQRALDDEVDEGSVAEVLVLTLDGPRDAFPGSLTRLDPP
jgi:CheY-like chemotaxis protein